MVGVSRVDEGKADSCRKKPQKAEKVSSPTGMVRRRNGVCMEGRDLVEVSRGFSKSDALPR